MMTKNNENIDALSEMLFKMTPTVANGVKDGLIQEYKKVIDSEVAEGIVEDVMNNMSSKQMSAFSGSSYSVKSKKVVDGGCSFILVRGARQGSTCGKGTIKGINLCSTHKKTVEKKTGEKIKIPVGEMVSDEMFSYKKTALIVVRKDFTKPISKTNCEVVGKRHPFETKLQDLEEDDKKYIEKEELDISTN